jgi:8-hydroxy-5-deazaflavin:NADPH oxidoreductase
VNGRTVAVVGAGIVGRTLAAGWARAGHHVVLGSRQPDSDQIRQAVADTGAQRAARPVDAVAAADVTVLTVPGDQVADLVTTLGETLRGRVVVDSTNSLHPDAAALHSTDLLRAAGATSFRAFSTTGWEQMARPVFGDERSDLPYAGPDTAARATVARLVEDIGFRPVWLGDGPEALAITDSLTRLWFHLAFTQGWGRRLGWRLLTDQDDPAG